MALIFRIDDTELLSVVDENDCIIDTCPRHIIDATGLRHRTPLSVQSKL